MNILNCTIIEQIDDSNNSLIYRAVRNEDRLPVILKEDSPTPEELTRYRQEYDITRLLSNVDGFIKVYDIEKYQNTFVIIMEDFSGESLKHWLAERKFTRDELLQLAIFSAIFLTVRWLMNLKN